MSDFKDKKKLQKLGLPPGTARYIGDEKPSITESIMYVYNSHKLEKNSIDSIEKFNEALIRDSNNIWLNITGLSDLQWIESLCNSINIHPLVIEDIFNTKQRPKIDVYDDYIFITLKKRKLDSSDSMDYEQISFIIKNNVLITFQEKADDFFKAISKRLQNHESRLRKFGIDYLAYLLIDTIVDDYLNIIEEKADELEDIENNLIENPDKCFLDKLYILKREYIHLRKIILPIKEVVGILIRQDIISIKDYMNFYLRDLYDHCLRLIESIDSNREMSTSIIEIYLSSVSNKMNETMRLLTIFASIFIPLTFIAGVYGMNFKYMPELTWRYGYYFTLGIMAFVIIILLAYFRKKKWF